MEIIRKVFTILRIWLFGQKFYYRRRSGYSLTPCPHGGSMGFDETFRPGAKMGSTACIVCIHNLATDYHSVICKKVPPLRAKKSLNE